MMKLNKKTLVLIQIILGLFILSGCSKHGVLMPGQSESDCEAAGEGGVCGMPRTLFIYQEDVKAFKGEEDKAYKITEEGNIVDIESGEIVKYHGYAQGEIPDFVKKDKTDEEKNENNIVKKSLLSGKNPNIKLSNNNMIVPETDTLIPIRDAGKLQEAWIAPYKYRGTLLGSKTITIEVRKADWIIGEETPKATVKQTSEFPSVLSNKILSGYGKSPSAEESRKMKTYRDTRESKNESLDVSPEDINKMDAYLKSRKEEQ